MSFTFSLVYTKCYLSEPLRTKLWKVFHQTCCFGWGDLRNGNLLCRLLHVYLMCTQFGWILKQHLRLYFYKQQNSRRAIASTEWGNRITDLLNKFRCKAKLIYKVPSTFRSKKKSEKIFEFTLCYIGSLWGKV